MRLLIIWPTNDALLVWVWNRRYGNLPRNEKRESVFTARDPQLEPWAGPSLIDIG
jgi:hypothetical protein